MKLDTSHINVLLRPDTLQYSYLEYSHKTLNVEAYRFNDGSIKVTIPNINNSLNHRYCEITAHIESCDDLMIIAQIKEIIERFSTAPKMFTLVITSTPYTRYDRVMLDDQTDSFGAKVFANLVNSLEFDCVHFFDCHSKVMLDLIKNSDNIDQNHLVEDTLFSYSDELHDYNIIAPDKGAVTKLNNLGIEANMVFSKSRDVATGKISPMKIVKDESDETKEYLVIDDICEGGGTFIGLAEIFKKHKNAHLNLYVTHGIFSNNAIEKLLNHYSKIYVQFMKESLYNSLPEEQKDKVFVNKLVKI